MTAQTVRSRVTIALPDVGLKPGEAIAVNVIKRSIATGQTMGGIGLFIVAEQSKFR